MLHHTEYTDDGSGTYLTLVALQTVNYLKTKFHDNVNIGLVQDEIYL